MDEQLCSLKPKPVSDRMRVYKIDMGEPVDITCCHSNATDQSEWSWAFQGGIADFESEGIHNTKIHIDSFAVDIHGGTYECHVDGLVDRLLLSDLIDENDIPPGHIQCTDPEHREFMCDIYGMCIQSNATGHMGCMCQYGHCGQTCQEACITYYQPTPHPDQTTIFSSAFNTSALLALGLILTLLLLVLIFVIVRAKRRRSTLPPTPSVNTPTSPFLFGGHCPHCGFDMTAAENGKTATGHFSSFIENSCTHNSLPLIAGGVGPRTGQRKSNSAGGTPAQLSLQIRKDRIVGVSDDQLEAILQETTPTNERAPNL